MVREKRTCAKVWRLKVRGWRFGAGSGFSGSGGGRVVGDGAVERPLAGTSSLAMGDVIGCPVENSPPHSHTSYFVARGCWKLEPVPTTSASLCLASLAAWATQMQTAIACDAKAACAFLPTTLFRHGHRRGARRRRTESGLVGPVVVDKQNSASIKARVLMCPGQIRCRSSHPVGGTDLIHEGRREARGASLALYIIACAYSPDDGIPRSRPGRPVLEHPGRQQVMQTEPRQRPYRQPRSDGYMFWRECHLLGHAILRTDGHCVSCGHSELAYQACRVPSPHYLLPKIPTVCLAPAVRQPPVRVSAC